MIKLISKTDGKIALTALWIATLLLLIIFMVNPIRKAEAIHCAGILCAEDVFNTKHNLNQNTDIKASGTTEVCIFCHTPHGGRTQIGSAPSGQAPLWNRALRPSGAYTPYSSPNFDAVDPGNTLKGLPKGVSLACLSCHDGTISFDALVNPPGSGGFIPSNLGDIAGPGTNVSNITFNGGGVDTNDTFRENAALRAESTAGGFLGGIANLVDPTGTAAKDTINMNPYPNLGIDLTDDHPIGIQMPGDANEDPQFTQVYTNRSANVDGGSGNDGSRVSYVSRYGNQGALGTTLWSADKRDRVRLYPSVSGQLSEYVECASCHNPHTPRPLFLRLPTASSTTSNTYTAGGAGVTLVTGAVGDLSHDPNQGSLVCLSCHQK